MSETNSIIYINFVSIRALVQVIHFPRKGECPPIIAVDENIAYQRFFAAFNAVIQGKGSRYLSLGKKIDAHSRIIPHTSTDPSFWLRDTIKQFVPRIL